MYYYLCQYDNVTRLLMCQIIQQLKSVVTCIIYVCFLISNSRKATQFQAIFNVISILQ